MLLKYISQKYMTSSVIIYLGKLVERTTRVSASLPLHEETFIS